MSMEPLAPLVSAPDTGPAKKATGSLWTRVRGQALWLAIIGILVFLVLPSFLDGYWVRTLTNIFMYACLASSLNLIAGITGYADFGGVVYFGVGAYATGIFMTKFAFPLVPAMLVGALICAAYAALLGLPILRLKGHYFAIASLGVMEATSELIRNWTPVTGGGSGLNLPLPGVPPEIFFPRMYYAMFGLLALIALINWLVLNSRFGYGLRAIKADEDAAQVVGVNTVAYKVMVWALSAALNGLVGGLYAYWTSYIEPKQVFDMLITLRALIMMLVGGAGTVLGPIIGAFLLEGISDFAWSNFLEWHLATLGGLVIIVVLFMPEGFLNMAGRLGRRLAARRGGKSNG